jgi:hypothetical protein
LVRLVQLKILPDERVNGGRSLLGSFWKYLSFFKFFLILKTQIILKCALKEDNNLTNHRPYSIVNLQLDFDEIRKINF